LNRWSRRPKTRNCSHRTEATGLRALSYLTPLRKLLNIPRVYEDMLHFYFDTLCSVRVLLSWVINVAFLPSALRSNDTTPFVEKPAQPLLS
jgi:hypothetical protein